VDRNVESNPGEDYAGPVYGPPMVHRIEREATFVFDFPAGGSGQKDGGIQVSGSSTVAREDFPQLLKAVIATYWPPVVQDENCQLPVGVGSAYGGAQCTGSYVKTPLPPEAPCAANGEDCPGPSDFNAVVGNQLTIVVHMRLKPNATQRATGD
jgi:hypothetical protein